MATAPTPLPLATELRRTYFTLLTGLTLVAVVLAALSWLLLGSIQPELRYDTELVRTLRLNNEAMLDRSAALNSWIATGDPTALEQSRTADGRSKANSGQLLRLVGNQASFDRAILEVELAAQAWDARWATPTEALDPTELDGEATTALLADGRRLFRLYRSAQQEATGLVSEERDELLAELQRAIAVGVAVAGVTLVGVGVILAYQRRRLARELSGPVTQLIDGLEAMRDGDVVAFDEVGGPAELQLLASHLRDTSLQVRAQHDALQLQRAESEAAAVALRGILAVAREIAGSLNVRYVAETVADAAVSIAPCERAVVWLTSDGHDFLAVHDSSLGHGASPLTAPVPLGTGPVGTVASGARPQHLDGSACFPLVVGGRVMGVLELAGSGDLDDGVWASLETLATHGAAALEAARLHRATEELAQTDPLTRLLNRRRMDDDLATELDRANRYGRPLGFIMLDLDRFKLLNDTFGHQHGDEVLRITAEYLTATLRTSDTVYRYGGEEFAILVREGTHAACLELAERLRAGVAGLFAERDGFSVVTASFGVAVAPEHGRTAAELILAADAALYRAKEAGRDRVCIAPLGADADAAPGVSALVGEPGLL